MSISEWTKCGLTVVGGRASVHAPRLLNGAANFLETGRLLREREIRTPRRVASRFDVFDVAIREMRYARPLYLEFGVYEGETIRYWSEHLTDPTARFFGFDSFEGLPEDWTSGAGRGHFSTNGRMPSIDDDRVTFVTGWFQESLASFEMADRGRLFINVDSDLYSSAATVLDWAIDHLNIGDFVYFDEFHDRLNEGKAFHEFLDRSCYQVDMVAATRSLSQVLFRRSA